MASCPNDMFGFKKQHYTVGVNSQRQTLYGFFLNYYFSFVKSARSSIRQIGKGLVTSHCILSSFSVLWLCSCMDENTNSFALLCAITTNLTLFYPVWDQLQQTERGTGANRPQPSHLFWLHFGKGFCGGGSCPEAGIEPGWCWMIVWQAVGGWTTFKWVQKELVPRRLYRMSR